MIGVVVLAVAVAIDVAPTVGDSLMLWHLKNDIPAAQRAPSSFHAVETVVADIAGLIPGAAVISVPLAVVSLMSKHPSQLPMTEGQTRRPQHGWIER